MNKYHLHNCPSYIRRNHRRKQCSCRVCFFENLIGHDSMCTTSFYIGSPQRMYPKNNSGQDRDRCKQRINRQERNTSNLITVIHGIGIAPFRTQLISEVPIHGIPVCDTIVVPILFLDQTHTDRLNLKSKISHEELNLSTHTGSSSLIYFFGAHPLA